jgi:16S rRNA (uracil1498-N3)-methyltransferase
MSERLRRFLLATAPAAGRRPELAAEDEAHALRVLRLRAGDRFEGIDGRGRAWEIEVGRAQREGLELLPQRELAAEPRPGETGARLPWIEVAASLPKGGRAEELVGRLAQLGIARLSPLISARSAEAAREFGGPRRARLQRIALEALKQSGRLWALEIGEAIGLEALAAGGARELLLLAPHARERFFDWTAERRRAGANWTGARPLCVLAGPEGGFAAEEHARLLECGARELWLGAYVLRIETACEAAAAILAAGLGRPT